MASTITLVIATSILVLIPGPKAALIAVNSLRHDFRLALITSPGTVFASSARRLFGRFGHLRNKVTGGFLLGPAAGLALSRRTL